MKEMFAFLGQNAAYILSVVTAFLALRIAWDIAKSGGGLVRAVSTGLALVVTFFLVINGLPWLFEYGVNQSYTHYQQGSVSNNLIKIASGATDLLVTSRQAQVNLEVPEAAALKDAADVLYTAATGDTGSAESAAPVNDTQSAAPVAPAVAPAAVAAPAASKPVANDYSATTIADAVAPIAPLLRKSDTVAPVATVAPVKPQAAAPVVTDLLAAPTQTSQEYIEQFLKDNGAGGGGPGTYTVSRGDSMAKIAEKYGISVAALCAANVGVTRNNCNVIRVGWVLAIP